MTMSAKDFDHIRNNVDLVIRELGPLSNIEFGLNRASVEWVEGFIERQRARPDFDPNNAGIVTTLGCFLGECLIAAVNGRWQLHEGLGWSVEFAPDRFAFPLAKVEKQLRYGQDGGDSILSFYDTTVTLSAGAGGDGETNKLE